MRRLKGTSGYEQPLCKQLSSKSLERCYYSFQDPLLNDIMGLRESINGIRAQSQDKWNEAREAVEELRRSSDMKTILTQHLNHNESAKSIFDLIAPQQPPPPPRFRLSDYVRKYQAPAPPAKKPGPSPNARVRPNRNPPPPEKKPSLYLQVLHQRKKKK